MQDSRIESRSNPLIREMRTLGTPKGRRTLGRHLVEGERLVGDALRSGAPVEMLFYVESFPIDRLSVPASVRRFVVSESVLEAITDSRTPQGVAASVITPDTAVPARFPEALGVVLDGVQDPGNVGTIIRSADAFGAGFVLLSAACADPFSPKAVRAAMGSTYHLPIFAGDVPSALDTLVSDGFLPLCGHLNGSETLPALPEKTVLVIGNEGNGVSDAVARRCTLYRLPMFGRAESLNASVAAGILLYALRNAINAK